jgi:hypothetical protein
VATVYLYVSMAGLERLGIPLCLLRWSNSRRRMTYRWVTDRKPDLVVPNRYWGRSGNIYLWRRSRVRSWLGKDAEQLLSGGGAS